MSKLVRFGKEDRNAGKKRKRVVFEEDDDATASSEGASSRPEEDESSSSGSEGNSSKEPSSAEEESEEENADGPRMSQWVDEDEIEYEEEAERDMKRDEKKDLKQGLASLSFGALLKAKKTLELQQEQEDPSESPLSSDIEEEESVDEVLGVEAQHPTEQKEKKEKIKRANKHAPMEMSSKRPVSRKRLVVETVSTKFRDPRFEVTSGELSTDHFRNNYSFLSEVREKELKSLKDSLARARKLWASSPAHIREERWAEVERLDRAVKRAESTLEREKREAVERDAIHKAKKDERLKRAQGKKAWYLKKGDEKKLKIQARFESLSGREAKKVMEKKQRKIAQKEKKSRPFAPGQRGIAGPRKRLEDGARGDGSRKRKRV